MSKRSLAFGICILLMCSAFIPISLGFNVKILKIKQQSNIGNGKTLYVGGSGPDNYTRIQDAINNAVNGDTVFVYNDSSPYKESLIINKSINLIGEERHTTTISGNEYADTNIHDDGVKISNFTIIGRIYLHNYLYNIHIQNNIFPIGGEINIDYCGYCNVSENEIHDSQAGIWMKYSYNITIYGNYFHDNEISIYADFCDNLTICRNIIENNKYQGIILEHGNNNHITENIISYSSSGLTVWSEENDVISGNTVTHNKYSGISVSSSGFITNNYIFNNTETGLGVSGDFHVTDNHISDNKGAGISGGGAGRAVIERNNLINNNVNAYYSRLFIDFTSKTIWKSNYYSDYRNERLYIIPGHLYFLIFFKIPWFQIDWNPALKPYDIEV